LSRLLLRLATGPGRMQMASGFNLLIFLVDPASPARRVETDPAWRQPSNA